MYDPSLIPARVAATLLGFAPRKKSGAPSNHSQFLADIGKGYPDFPRFRWLGGRKMYVLGEIEAFRDRLEKESRPGDKYSVEAA